MSSFAIILDGPYLRVGSVEMYLNKFTYARTSEDKLIEVTRTPKAIEVVLFTWHLYINRASGCP